MKYFNFLYEKLTLNIAWLLFFLCYAILGQVLNKRYFYNYFSIIQLLFYLIIFICFILFRLVYKKVINLKGLFDNDKSYNLLFCDFFNKSFSLRTILLSVFFVLFSSIEFVVLKILPLNLMGLYLFLIMSFSLVISMLGYIICSHYIFFLRKFSKLKIRTYNRFEPANTPDLKLMSNLMNLFIIGFLGIGLIYVIIYFLVAPISAINFYKFFSLYNVVYFITWLTILVLIIFGFIFIFCYSQNLFKHIIDNWKELSKNDMNFFLKNSNNLNNFEKIKHINRFLSISSYINNSANDVNDYTIYLISFAFSFSSLFIHFVNLFESLNTIVEVFFNIPQ